MLVRDYHRYKTITLQGHQVRFLFLNVGHFLDHFFMLIFATVAALQLTQEWGLSYAELIPYATPGFIAFGVCAIPAGWLADKWSRDGMIAIFFIGIGVSSIFASLAANPLQIALGLTCIGVFAAIYHPVGLAMVVEGREKTGVPLAINGIFGNMGVASAALIAGFLIDRTGWESAFVFSGVVSIVVGVLYLLFLKAHQRADNDEINATEKTQNTADEAKHSKRTFIRVFCIIMFTTALGGLVFQSTTFALPKVLDERLTTIADTATLVGWYTFLVFTIAAFAQLIVGYLVDNYTVRVVFVGVAMLQALFFLLMMHVSGVAALVIAMGFMLAVFGQIPINDVLVARLVRSEWRSRAYAMRYVVTFSVMATTVPFIAWVHSTWGFSELFAVLAFAALSIFCAALYLPKI